MKGMVKTIIIGVIIAAIGIGVLLTGLALSGWTVGQPDFQMERYDAVDENTSIEVEFGAGAVKTEYYDGDKIAIDYPTAKGFYCEITEGQGKLKFETKKKWFLINFGNWNIPETVIYLPRNVVFDIDFDLGAGKAELASGAYGRIDIEISAGALTLNDSECTVFEGTVNAGALTVNRLVCNTFGADVNAGKFDVTGLTCNTFSAKVSAGRLAVSSLECPDIRTKVSAGSAELTVKGSKSDYNITASVSAGSCNVSSQTGATDKKINAHCSAGSIVINFSN